MVMELSSRPSSRSSQLIRIPQPHGITAVSTNPILRPPFVAPPNPSSKPHYYKIVNKQHTASASLLFAQHRETKERVVIKILRDHKITRYRLVTSEEQLRYQLEALYWNKKFTPQVYMGVARILGWSYNPDSIVIGEIIENPTKENIVPNAEYALVMHELPMDRRLDILLNKGDEISLQNYIRILSEYVAYMHIELVGAPLPSENNFMWGNFEQLQKKLEHNLALIDLLLKTNENGQYSSSKALRDIFSHLHLQSLYRRNPVHQLIHNSRELKVSDEQKDTLDKLKSNLRKILRQNPYQRYFEKRIQQQRIKRCHGDLKAPHIWITPYNYLSDTEPWEYVRVIDAIDFNPTYCNIDILSDLAMLLLDIQARTKSSMLTNRLLEDYLRLTGQEDEISRSVLAYYLIEKAIMWTAVSIIYDDLPNLGLAFLDIANNHMADVDTLFEIPSPYIITLNETIQDDRLSTALHSDFR